LPSNAARTDHNIQIIDTVICDLLPIDDNTVISIHEAAYEHVGGSKVLIQITPVRRSQIANPRLHW
jgi:hypothetical protein